MCIKGSCLREGSGEKLKKIKKRTKQELKTKKAESFDPAFLILRKFMRKKCL
jgi:hypothetical protein